MKAVYEPMTEAMVAYEEEIARQDKIYNRIDYLTRLEIRGQITPYELEELDDLTNQAEGFESFS